MSLMDMRERVVARNCFDKKDHIYHSIIDMAAMNFTTHVNGIQTGVTESEAP